MFTEVQEERLVRAIAEAERGNRGEVRLHVERRCVTAPVLRAQALYRQLGLDQTRDDTAVLLYVAHESRVAALWGGAGIHDHARPEFWRELSESVAQSYSRGHPVDGLCESLERLGELLRDKVPGDDSAGNELPDVVTSEAWGEALQETLRERSAARARQAKQERLWLGVAAAGVLALALVGWQARATGASLVPLHAEVTRARAQVENVREREAEVLARMEGAAPGPERDAEIAGASNRVRVERGRYDSAAAAYNAATSSAWARLCAKLSSLPERAPLSNTEAW
jgi:hypothetical protein